MDAQEMALAGQATETKLRSRLQDLEQQMVREEKWATEISRYKLVQLPRNGGMAYALREEFLSEDQPMHYLCTNCSEDGIKTFCKTQV